jgi:hypothetical protein
MRNFIAVKYGKAKESPQLCSAAINTPTWTQPQTTLTQKPSLKYFPQKNPTPSSSLKAELLLFHHRQSALHQTLYYSVCPLKLKP